jgi:hypothetical protein
MVDVLVEVGRWTTKKGEEVAMEPTLGGRSQDAVTSSEA